MKSGRRKSSHPLAGVDRRSFLFRGAVTALALSNAAVKLPAAAEAITTGSKPGRVSPLIDVHHHLFPPAMVEVLRSKWPMFSLPGVRQSLAEMNATGTTTAMISYPNNDILSLEEKRLTTLIRSANDYAAGLVSKYPKRYGLFASLPMPHVEASLRELARAFDDLHADGILLVTSYDNKWLGDPAFEPLRQELNARQAVVFVHPGVSSCCRNLLPGLSDSIVEFETDTARTIASLVFSGTAERFPRIKFIFSHCGGTMPILIERFTSATRPSPDVAKNIPKGVEAYLRSFHYDTAQAANPVALGALLQIVAASQVLFGTDFPYRQATDQVRAIQAMKLSPAELKGIFSGNAELLLPRLTATA